jgi:hypothetical protein
MKSRIIKLGEHNSCMEQKKNAFNMSITKTEGKRPFRKRTDGKIMLRWRRHFAFNRNSEFSLCQKRTNKFNQIDRKFQFG